MSFNIRRGTLGSLAMHTAIRNASSRVSWWAIADARVYWRLAERQPIQRYDFFPPQVIGGTSANAGNRARRRQTAIGFRAGLAECSPRALSDLYCRGAGPVKPEPAAPTMLLLPYVSILPPPTADVAPVRLLKIDVLLTSAAAFVPFA
jgi:hypothetical protein